MAAPSHAHELRDSHHARQYLLQGLWLSRLVPPTVESVETSLQLAAKLLAVGDPLPPLGLVADVGRLVNEAAHTHSDADAVALESALPHEVVQRYEDNVLGKLYADGGFERGSTAICRYSEKDRLRGTAWLIGRFAERAGFGGVHLSPNVVRSLLTAPREETLAEGAESLRSEGFLPLLEESYRQIIECVRHLGDVLGAEDVFELEHGTVLVEFGQRLALRQMLQMAAQLEAAIPQKPPHIISRHRNVPTHLLDEDTYPVGGFSSISNTGTIESLLHSQLAYMESDTAQRPDLFDIKFLRGELLYYARDENEFLRRRRTILFLLWPDLADARIKDLELPCQRIVLVLASVLAVTRRLLSWLRDEALQIEILVPSADETALQDERELLQMALEDQIANGIVHVGIIAPDRVAAHVGQSSRRSLTSTVDIAMRARRNLAGDEMPIRLRVNQPAPRLQIGDETEALEPDDLSGWQSAACQLMVCLMQGT